MNQTIVGSRSGSIDFEGNKSAFVFIFYFDKNVRQNSEKLPLGSLGTKQRLVASF